VSPTFDVSRAVQLRQQRMKWRDIGPLLGISWNAVTQYFKRHPELLPVECRSLKPQPLRRCWECYRLSQAHRCPRCGPTFPEIV
jgi:hypothetical protein